VIQKYYGVPKIIFDHRERESSKCRIIQRDILSFSSLQSQNAQKPFAISAITPSFKAARPTWLDTWMSLLGVMS